MQQPRLATESIRGQRPYQEDSLLSHTLSDGRILLAVADGMGGHAAGEVASALALETLVEAVEGGRSLEDAFRLANDRVHSKAEEPGKQGMGTTLVAMLLDGDGYAVANVGDSRCYVISAESGTRQITEDHSFVAEAQKRGQTEEEALASQWKDALTRSIGTDPEVEVDVFGPFPVEGDSAVLLCSDGLYKTLSDSDLGDLFAQSGGLRGAAQSLVSAAYERGSDDNISVAIAEFGEVPRMRTAGTMPLEFEPPDEVVEPEPDQAKSEVETSAAPDEPDPAPVATATGTPLQTGPPVGMIVGLGIFIVVMVIAFLVVRG